MDTVQLTIDGRPVTVPAGSTILEAARAVGIAIPTLCYHPDLAVRANCRICTVEVAGARTLQAACSQPVQAGMVVKTATPRVRETRQINLELLLANHPQDCLNCGKNSHCELRSLAADYNVRAPRFSQQQPRDGFQDHSNPSIVRDPAKCILCRRCVAVCHEVQGVGALYPMNRGVDTVITPIGSHSLAEVPCAFCGQCIQACPVGALQAVDDTERAWALLADPAAHVIVQTAPAVRVAIGEEFGMAPGTVATGKLVAALRRLGFDRVFDTDFSADVTIMEEGHELLERIQHGGTLPLITSCSPGWIKYMEHFYPEFLDNLSTCKSPQQMFGALAKTYYAEQSGIAAERIKVISIMPCTAKKFECTRPEMNASGYQDVDLALTTRELGRMLREAGIRFTDLLDEEYDAPLGISTGAAAIFGATGGVMEAAVRTVYEVVTGNELPRLELTAVRGLDGVKEATLDLNGTAVKVAVAHGLANAAKIMDRMKAGTADYHFIEIMACPGGCIGGGGQPYPTNTATRQARIQAIYAADRNLPLRKSHQNPAVQELYRDFLCAPLSERSHQLLHTHYTERGKYPGINDPQ